MVGRNEGKGMTEETNVKNIIKQLVEQQDQIDNIVVAFSFKGSAMEDKIAIGMSKHTNASWFFSAAEWIRFQVIEIVQGLRSAVAMQAALAQMDLDTDDEGKPRYDA